MNESVLTLFVKTFHLKVVLVFFPFVSFSVIFVLL